MRTTRIYGTVPDNRFQPLETDLDQGVIVRWSSRDSYLGNEVLKGKGGGGGGDACTKEQNHAEGGVVRGWGTCRMPWPQLNDRPTQRLFA